MSQELFYTSVPRGLQPGSRGFCTVAHTQGLVLPLQQKLESLSGYRPLFPPMDPKAHLNPVAWSHLKIDLMGVPHHVLSRVCAAGLDYSERTNKFAHHVVLKGNEVPPAGPAWLLGQPGFMETAWQGEPRILPAGRTPPRGEPRLGVCQAWQRHAGDAGWAGVLAEAGLADPGRSVYLVTELGLDPLPLFAEALLLLPAEQRWAVTFSTYFATVPQGVPCSWRWVQKDSPEAKVALRMPNSLVLDLTRDLGPAQGGALVEAARTGRMPRRAVPAPELNIPSIRSPLRRDGDESSSTFRRSARTQPDQQRSEPTPSPAPLMGIPVEPRRKGSEVPELDFVNDTRERRSNNMLFILGGAAVLLLGGALGAFFLLGNKQPLPDEAPLAMKGTEPQVPVNTAPRPPDKEPPTGANPVPIKAPDYARPLTSNAPAVNGGPTVGPAPVLPPPPDTPQTAPNNPPMVASAPTTDVAPSLPPPPNPMGSGEKPPKADPQRVTAYYVLPDPAPDREYSEDLKKLKITESPEYLLRLRGLGERIPDVEGAELKQISLPKEGTLKLVLAREVASSTGEAPVFATFSVKDGKLGFKWGYKIAGKEGHAVPGMVRDAVLEVGPSNGGPPVLLALRSLLQLAPVDFKVPGLGVDRAEIKLSTTVPQTIVPPSRPLLLELKAEKKPVFKRNKDDFALRLGENDQNGITLLFDGDEKGRLACATEAANFYYERVLLGKSLAIEQNTNGMKVQATLFIKRKDAKDHGFRPISEFDQDLKRLRNDRAINSAGFQKYNQLASVRNPEQQANITKAQEFHRRVGELNVEIKKMETERDHWIDAEKYLKTIQPVLSIPAAVIYMEVDGLRVDVYRIGSEK